MLNDGKRPNDMGLERESKSSSYSCLRLHLAPKNEMLELLQIGNAFDQSEEHKMGQRFQKPIY